MTRDEQLSSELRDATARMGRLFRSCGRGDPSAVDRLDEIMRDVARVANELHPRPRSPVAITAAEGRFTPGTIAARGRMVRVETRAPRRRAI